MKVDDAFRIIDRLWSFMPAPRISTYEAVNHIALRSIWSAWRRWRGDYQDTIFFNAIGKLEYGLRSWSVLNAEGFLFGESVAEKLPPDYWREAQLDRVDHLDPGGSDSRTEPLLASRRNPVENVTVLKWAVLLRWPSFRAAAGWAALACGVALVAYGLLALRHLLT